MSRKIRLTPKQHARLDAAQANDQRILAEADDPGAAYTEEEYEARWIEDMKATLERKAAQLNIEHIQAANDHLHKLYGVWLPKHLHQEFLAEYNTVRIGMASVNGSTRLLDPTVIQLAVVIAANRIYQKIVDAEKNRRREMTPDDGKNEALGYATKCVLKLVHTTEGNRNNQLNETSHEVGRVVGGGFLAESAARAELERAAAHIGLEPSEYLPTIESGLTAGMARGWL